MSPMNNKALKPHPQRTALVLLRSHNLAVIIMNLAVGEESQWPTTAGLSGTDINGAGA